MKLYLVRHAIAAPTSTTQKSDKVRPLTKNGLIKMHQATQGLAKIINPPDRIFCSSLRRSIETAQIISRKLGCEDPIQLPALDPEADAITFISALSEYKNLKSILMVGHQPNLSLIAARLLGAEKISIEFKKGSVACFSITQAKPLAMGTLLWHLSPRTLRTLAAN